jgi:hypothetical protein
MYLTLLCLSTLTHAPCSDAYLPHHNNPLSYVHLDHFGWYGGHFYFWSKEEQHSDLGANL